MRALALILLAAILAGCSGAVAQASPVDDGLDLAVVRAISGNPPRDQLLLIDADGRQQGRVLPSPTGVTRAGGLGWTPDGRLLLIGAAGEQIVPTPRAARNDVFVVAPGGGEPGRITDVGDVVGAAMSPDGSAVAVARQTLAARFERSSSALWLVDADGSDLRPLLPGTPGRADLPGAWSPDGRQLVFTRSLPPLLGPRGRLTSRTSVWVVNGDGTGARRLAEGRSPAWSPDGTRIALASARDRNGEICGNDTCRVSAELYTASPDGSGLRRITHTEDDEDLPAWSSDGRWLAFEREESKGPRFTDTVWTMRADGSCAGPLAHDRAGLVSYRSPVWRPGAAVERDCVGRARHAAVPDVPIRGLAAARAVRGHPLYWLGPEWSGRRLLDISSGRPDPRSRYFHYGDCRTLDGDCDQLQYQITDVCRAPPPNVRGPLPFSVTRTRIRGAPAFLVGFGQWEVYTGRVVIRVFSGGRKGRRVIAALRGLNAPAKGLRPGRPFPPPIPGALERQLPCPPGG